MATHLRASGIKIDVPDDVSIVEPGKPVTTRRGGRRQLPKGPVPLPAASATAPADDPVVAAMLAQDLILVDVFDLSQRPGAARRGKAAPSRLTIDVANDEDSAILFEQDGIYTWRYPQESKPVAVRGAQRGPVRAHAIRRVTFDLSVTPAPTPKGRRRLGPIADFVIGQVRTYVFRFVARLGVGAAIGFLERKKYTGLVQLSAEDPLHWTQLERLSSLPLPTDRAARILLLVHGTFSSTVGSYGALGITDEGLELLTRAGENYDAIIGYDHRTLSYDPLQNAEDLLSRLEAVDVPALEIDAVAYSRGGLVLRSLIEYLLPHASVKARVRRAVFVGATNGGTQLAARENWERLIDLTTNLVALGCRALSIYAPAAVAAAITRASIETLGALVKCLTTEVLDEDSVPGLAAMVPTGPFVTEINKVQPGQPTAAESLYYVISSEFNVQGILQGQGAKEFPARLARWVADAIVDAAMKEANDLVVNTASMSAIDDAAGVFVKDRWHFENNPNVYHTIYFAQKEVVAALNRWLELDDGADLSRGRGARRSRSAPRASRPPRPWDEPREHVGPAASLSGTKRSAPLRKHMKKKNGAARASAPPKEAAAPRESQTKTPTGTVFVAGDMPAAFAVGESVLLNVLVSHDEIVVSTGPTKVVTKVKVALDRQLIVQVIAKRHVRIIKDDYVEIDPAELRTELVFRIEGASAGEGEVWVQVSQGPRIIAKLILRPTITGEGELASQNRVVDAADGRLAAPDDPRYPVLQIFETQPDDGLRYHFVVQLGDGKYISRYSEPLRMPREDYVNWIYKEIETRWLENEDDFEAFEQELRTYGGTLLDELVPPDVQAGLWNLRKKLKAVQVVAEEPFIPWELVHLKEPGQPLGKERHFLAEKGLVRWLHNEGAAPPAITVHRDRSYFVIPEYPHPDFALPEAQREIPYLKKTFGSRPLEAKNTAIVKLLSTPGAVDHFHFSGHGEAETNDAVFAQIMLGGTIDANQWTPRYLKSDVISQSAQLVGTDGGQPLVMLNACQVGRLGWHLTSIGGFAQSFIHRGAGVFVGSLWAVGDVPARHFSEAFYRALLDDQTLAAAATAGRRAARDEGDGTYLAFVVYGAPHAKLRVMKASGG